MSINSVNHFTHTLHFLPSSFYFGFNFYIFYPHLRQHCNRYLVVIPHPHPHLHSHLHPHFHLHPHLHFHSHPHFHPHPHPLPSPIIPNNILSSLPSSLAIDSRKQIPCPSILSSFPLFPPHSPPPLPPRRGLGASAFIMSYHITLYHVTLLRRFKTSINSRRTKMINDMYHSFVHFDKTTY